MDVTTFLQAQTREYQRHASHAAELRATLEQLNMEMYKTIPREYQPKQLKARPLSLKNLQGSITSCSSNTSRK